MCTGAAEAGRVRLGRRARLGLVFVALLSTVTACGGNVDQADVDTTDSATDIMAGFAVPRQPLAPADSALVTTLEQLAKTTHDKVTSGDWSWAAQSVDSIAATLAPQDAARSAYQIPLVAFDSALSALQRSIAARARLDALTSANNLSLAIIPFMANSQRALPWQLSLLDVYGSEMEVAAERNDIVGLNAITTLLRDAWASLRPQMAIHDGVEERAAFDMLVSQLTHASTAQEFTGLAREVRRSVNEIEGLWAP